MPMRGELPAVRARPYIGAPQAKTGWSRLMLAISNPELQTIVAFSAIGILLMLNLALLFPDFGAMVANAQSFP